MSLIITIHICAKRLLISTQNILWEDIYQKVIRLRNVSDADISNENLVEGVTIHALFAFNVLIFHL